MRLCGRYAECSSEEDVEYLTARSEPADREIDAAVDRHALADSQCSAETLETLDVLGDHFYEVDSSMERRLELQYEMETHGRLQGGIQVRAEEGKNIEDHFCLHQIFSLPPPPPAPSALHSKSFDHRHYSCKRQNKYFIVCQKSICTLSLFQFLWFPL